MVAAHTTEVVLTGPVDVVILWFMPPQEQDVLELCDDRRKASGGEDRVRDEW